MSSAGTPARFVKSTYRKTPFHARLRPRSDVDLLCTSMPARLMGIARPLRLRSCGGAIARSMCSRSPASALALGRAEPPGAVLSVQDTAAARKTTVSLRTKVERVTQILELAIIVESRRPPALELQRPEKR